MATTATANASASPASQLAVPTAAVLTKSQMRHPTNLARRIWAAETSYRSGQAAGIREAVYKAHNVTPPSFWNELFRRKVGEIDPLPPIPPRFFELETNAERAAAARIDPRDYALVPVPESITITVPGNSKWTLRKLTENGMKRLVHLPFLPPSLTPRSLVVPLTLNNLFTLWRNFVRVERTYRYWGIFGEESLAYFQEHGDEGSGPTHWTYQSKTLIGIGRKATNQIAIAHDSGFEVVSLIDRLFYHFIRFLLWGVTPLNDFIERTAVTSHRGQDPSAGICWTFMPRYRVFNLVLLRPGNSFVNPLGRTVNQGAPVGIPYSEAR